MFSQEECSRASVIFGVNTYCMPKGVISALLRRGMDSWFFITADHAFGHALEADASNFVRQGGGKALGAVRAPTHSTDYSSFLLQAQASGAKVIGLAVQGADFQNLVKQATEFGLRKSGVTVAGLFVLDNQMIGAGLDNTAGMVASGALYRNMNDDTRAFAKRIMRTSGGVPPNGVQAAPYSATLHYLRDMEAAGALDGQAMRPMYLMQVKTPAESTTQYDIFKIQDEISPQDSWKPLSQSVCPFIVNK